MKFKTNISGVLLAVIVFMASNGIAISEHFCNTSQTHDFSFFKETKCEMEKPQNSCCSKKMVKKKNCCEHKQCFKKLSIEGYTSKHIEIKPFERFVLNELWTDNYFSTNKINSEKHLSGILPPNNLHIIKYLLRPSRVVLQIFLC